MIRKLDKLWLKLLGMTHRWVLRRADAHYRREKLRRLRRLQSWPTNFLN